MNTVALERPPEPPAPVAPAVALPNGAPPSAPGWLIVGPRLREHLGPQLERALPLVWLALLEMSGAQDGQGFRLVVDAAHLEPIAPQGNPAPP